MVDTACKPLSHPRSSDLSAPQWLSVVILLYGSSKHCGKDRSLKVMVGPNGGSAHYVNVMLGCQSRPPCKLHGTCLTVTKRHSSSTCSFTASAAQAAADPAWSMVLVHIDVYCLHTISRGTNSVCRLWRAAWVYCFVFLFDSPSFS